MTRLLLGCFLALCVGFVSGCGGGSTETTVVEPTTTQTQQELDDYEAEMDAEVITDG